MAKIRLAICDDDIYLCRYWKLLFDTEEGFDFVGTANTRNECIDLCEQEKPDVILLDIQMETSEAGLELIPEVKKVSPDTKIIMMTVHKEDKYIFRSYALGAKDYIYKTMPEEQWFKIIKNVYEDNLSLRPEIAEKIMAECQKVKESEKELRELFLMLSQLTTVQLEILKMVSEGYSYKEISKIRFIEESTVRVQVNKILKKFKNYSSVKALTDKMNELGAFEIL